MLIGRGIGSGVGFVIVGGWCDTTLGQRERVFYSHELHVGLTCAFELGSEKTKEKRKRHTSSKVIHSHVCWDVSW